MDQESVKKQAREILDSFAKALEKVKTKDIENFYVERKEFERTETGGACEDFKSKLLENSPQKNKDFIIAEKGNWKNG
ncbi:MAG: hypothetical protein AABX77_01425 [Nanoarchaeota archaeon]